MTQIYNLYTYRDGKIEEAIVEVGIDLEVKLGWRIDLLRGIPHKEFYDGENKVLEITYRRDQPVATIHDESFRKLAEELIDKINSD